jgi:hypothetical protein
VVAWGNNRLRSDDGADGTDRRRGLAGGGFHSLALKADGTVVAWGDNSAGATTVPAGLRGGLGLAAGYAIGLVLRDSSGDRVPTITTHPASQVVTDGENVSISVVATAGGAPVTYQWRKDSVIIAGATAASYTVNGFFGANVGGYDVVVSNYLGSVVSNAAVLTQAGPGITALSAPRQVVTVGQNLTLSVTANGATSYQWKRNGFAVARRHRCELPDHECCPRAGQRLVSGRC